VWQQPRQQEMRPAGWRQQQQHHLLTWQRRKGRCSCCVLCWRQAGSCCHLKCVHMQTLLYFKQLRQQQHPHCACSRRQWQLGVAAHVRWHRCRLLRTRHCLRQCLCPTATGHLSLGRHCCCTGRAGAAAALRWQLCARQQHCSVRCCCTHVLLLLAV
jgi:hypothetical protein